MQDQGNILFLKVAKMPIQNKRQEEIISLPWFVFSFLTSLAAHGHIKKKLAIRALQYISISYNIIKRAVEENIKIILLPPHTTNVLQPLDVGLFRSLKANFSKITDGIKILSVTGNYQNINKNFERSLLKDR